MIQDPQQYVQTLPGLPARLTVFVGRQRELAEITALLNQPDIRLLTLTGPGGSGKTRLALQAASIVAGHFADGCWFVDLAPITQSHHVPSAIARTLGVAETAGRSVDADLIAFLSTRQALLVLDNFEHILDAADLVSKILVAAPGVTILATSRVALQIYGEHDVPLAPLALPDPRTNDSDALLAADAVQLFLARAPVHPDPAWATTHAATIAAICRRLDGLPLAIELAAARVKTLPPDALLQRLTSCGALPLLSSGPRNAPLRQQTIRGTITWSYDLLSQSEQVLFARLGVFTGSFTAAAAAAVCGDDEAAVVSVAAAEDALAGLVEQSLLRVHDSPGDEVQYAFLQTVHEYALERLRERAEEPALRERHAAYYTAYVEAAEPHLRSMEQPAWLARLDGAYPNIRAALDWALGETQAAPGRAELGLRLAAALWSYWRGRGLFSEAYHWLSSSAMDNQALPVILRARAVVGIAWVADRQRLSEQSSILANIALTLARSIGDRQTLLRALVLAAGDDRDLAAATALRRECLDLAAEIADPWFRYHAVQRFRRPANDADPVEWQAFWDELEQLADASGDLWLRSDLLCDRFYDAFRHNDRMTASRMAAAHETVANRLGSRQAAALTNELQASLAWLEDRLDGALAHQEARLEIERALGNRSGIGYSLLEIAALRLDQGDFDTVEARLTEAMSNLGKSGDHLGICRASLLRAWNAAWRGDYAVAERYCDMSRSALRSTGRRELLEWMTDENTFLRGLLALMQGQFDRANAYFNDGLTLVRSSKRLFKGMGLNHQAGLGMTAARRGDYDAALEQIAPVVADMRELADTRMAMIARWIQGPVLLAAGRIDEAALAFAEGLEAARRRGARTWSMNMLDGAAACMAEHGDLSAAVRCWSAVDMLRRSLGMPRWPVDRPDYERHVAAARATLGATGFAAAWDAGQQLDWETALDTAVALLRQPALATAPLHTSDDDMRRELATAAAIQAGLLPSTLPRPPGWRIAALLAAARETAGDFYDCFTLPDGRIVLVIADVAGKGLGAALYMATGRALIRTLSATDRVEPAAIMAGVNAHLLEDTRADLFITAFYGVLDPHDGTLIYANAGHPPPFLIDSTAAQPQALMPTGLVLGVEPGVTWHQQTIRFEPGATLLLYTDGVTEAQDAAGGFFDTERLLAVLEQNRANDAETVVAQVAEAVRRFAGSAPQSDDITLLAVRLV